MNRQTNELKVFKIYQSKNLKIFFYNIMIQFINYTDIPGYNVNQLENVILQI